MNTFVTNLFPNPMPGETDEQLTVDATAGGVQFSSTYNIRTKFVTFDVQDASCRVTFDGSAPTSTNGHILYVGQSYTWSIASAKAAKFIRTGATSSVLHATQMTY